MRNLALLAIIAFTALTTPAWAGPAISFDQPVYDFGTILQGKKVDHIFVFRNKGTDPLTIGKLKTSCGCTAATVSAKTIPPGKTGEISVSFNSTSFSGNISKTVTVESNDPQSPATTLTLKGNVTEELSLTPRQLSLGNVKPDAKKEITVIFTNRSNRPVTLTSVKAGIPQVSVRTKKTVIKPGETSELVVTVLPRAEDRYISGYINILTDFPSKSEMVIPVYATVTK